MKHFKMLPSPLEVHRFISVFEWILEQSGLLFPSPLEVDRFISVGKSDYYSFLEGFSPLSR